MTVKLIVSHDNYFGTVMSIALKVVYTTFKMAPDIYIINHSKVNFFRSKSWNEMKKEEHPINYQDQLIICSLINNQILFSQPISDNDNAGVTHPGYM